MIWNAWEWLAWPANPTRSTFDYNMLRNRVERASPSFSRDPTLDDGGQFSKRTLLDLPTSKTPTKRLWRRLCLHYTVTSSPTGGTFRTFSWISQQQSCMLWKFVGVSVWIWLYNLHHDRRLYDHDWQAYDDTFSRDQVYVNGTTLHTTILLDRFWRPEVLTTRPLVYRQSWYFSGRSTACCVPRALKASAIKVGLSIGQVHHRFPTKGPVTLYQIFFFLIFSHCSLGHVIK